MYGVNIEVTNFTVLMYRYGDGKNNATPKIFLPSTVSHKIKVRRRHRVSLRLLSTLKFPVFSFGGRRVQYSKRAGGRSRSCQRLHRLRIGLLKWEGSGW